MNISELDYYAILGVSREANKEEITLAYRKLAIRLHPFRNPKHQCDFVPAYEENQLTHMGPLSAKLQWNYINMAFNVLGNDLYRAIYDRYGEAGLFQGVSLPNGYFPPYQYHGNDMLVYQKVFESYSPYANLIDVVVDPLPLGNKKFPLGKRTKDAPVEKIVELSLEEVYTGCVKIMQVCRLDYVDEEETRTEKIKKNLKINIEPGVSAGTRYCFKEEGDRSPTTIPADIIFIIADKPHKMFRRENHCDLIHTLEIDLCQALVGVKFVINTLDKRQLVVRVDDVIKPKYRKIIPGEGLPKCRNNSLSEGMRPQEFESKEYGDIIIEFKVRYPDCIPKEMKKHVRTLFAEITAKQNEELEKIK